MKKFFIKHSKNYLSVLVILFCLQSNIMAQSIQNGDFESGSSVTSTRQIANATGWSGTYPYYGTSPGSDYTHLFEVGGPCVSVGWSTDILNNVFTSNLAAVNGNRYAGTSGFYTKAICVGTILPPYPAACNTYRVEFMHAPRDSFTYNCITSVATPLSFSQSFSTMKMRVKLRNSSNSSDELIIGLVNLNPQIDNWGNYSFDFSINNIQALTTWDKIEFDVVNPSGPLFDDAFFLDNISLSLITTSTCCIKPCFELPDTICAGSPIIPNLDCMDDAGAYFWAFYELSPSNVWVKKYQTPYETGPVPVEDFTTLWNGFQAGKSYRILIDAQRNCAGSSIAGDTTSRIIYIAPKPGPFVSTVAVLGCNDLCASIGYDLNAFPSAEGYPFTALWDDNSTNFMRSVCPTQPTIYTVTYKNRWGCETPHDFFVDKDTCCLDPCFTLPDTICFGDPITPDLSCMLNNGTAYRWVFYELPLANPLPIMVYDSYFANGPVDPTDLTSLWNGFQTGKSYKISLTVTKDCGTQSLIEIVERYIYIAPKPGPFVSTVAVLGCNDLCASIGYDLNAFPSAEGYPFTALWDDNSTNFMRSVCPTQPTIYTVTYKNRWGCETPHDFFVDKDTCCLDPCFTLPDTICFGDPITPDLSCMLNNGTAYRWVFYELPLANPLPIMVYDSYFANGPVDPTDLTSLWNGFQTGKSYKISLTVTKDCGTQSLIETIDRYIYIKPKTTTAYNLTVYCNRDFTVNDIIFSIGYAPCSGTIVDIENLTDLYTYASTNPIFNVNQPTLIKITYSGCCELIVNIDCLETSPPNKPGRTNVVAKSDNGNSSEISIYPNPAIENVTLEWKANTIEESSIIVRSVDGRKVYQMIWDNNKAVNVNTSTWTPGTYIFTIKPKDGNQIIRKVTISK